MPSFTLPFVFLTFKSYIALTGSSVALISCAFFTASSTASLLFLAPFPKFRLTLVQSKGLAVKRSTRWDLLRKGAPKSLLWFLGERAKNYRFLPLSTVFFFFTLPVFFHLVHVGHSKCPLCRLPTFLPLCTLCFRRFRYRMFYSIVLGLLVIDQFLANHSERNVAF